MSDRQKSKAPRKSRPRKINRAQQKAIEVRASETRAEVQQQAAPQPVEVAPERPTERTGARAKARQRKAQQPVKHISQLSRTAEYAYIQADVRRLLYTAAVLLAVMIVILFVI